MLALLLLCTRDSPGTTAASVQVMARVLVAEDDIEMRRLVVEALHKDAHHVTEIADGGALLVRLAMVFERDPASFPIDVIVSDIRMPHYSALELLERFAFAGWKVPTILMTAFGDDDTRREAEALGACYLEKPLSLDVLRATVRRLANP
jgi:two-component system response regulator (stage 0 sporulation protein F)